MSAGNPTEKEKLESLIKPGTTLIIDFEFETGDRTRRIVTIPQQHGKSKAAGNEENSDDGLKKTLF